MSSPSEKPHPATLAEPPGGIFIWMLVALELVTFGAALVAFVVSARSDPEGYHASRQLLDQRLGLTNTLFLLTSGYFMAETLRHFRADRAAKARRSLVLTLAGGVLFLVFKGIEYADKVAHGHTLGTDSFFTWYWLLTVFHLMHVLVGMVILIRLLATLGRVSEDDLEAGGIFWHMCDIIWLLLFPALYLVF